MFPLPIYYLYIVIFVLSFVRAFRRTQMSKKSAAVNEYIYQPLNSSKQEIRLITIKAGREPDPIECSLTHVSLGDKPQYEALSYVWGDPNDRPQIILEGCNFSVTKNLGAALSSLRLQEVDRTMWIDAICIDQSNLAEREFQVQLMRDIYQEAVQVVSWMSALGTEDAAGHTTILLWEGQQNNFSIAWLQGALTSGTQCLARIFSMTQFCTIRHDYWSRIWITQEVALAKQGVVNCNKMEIPYEYFGEFSRTLSEIVNETVWMQKNLGVKNAYLLKELSEILGRNDIIRRIAPGTPLLDLLRQDRYKKATDPRDKVYALLGISDMPPNSHEGLIVKYGENWSKGDVYAGAVRAVVHKTSNLDIICEARPYADVLETNSSPDGQVLEVPSWAPDWTATFQKSMPGQMESRIGAAGLVPANVEFCNDKNVMRAQGICVGTVGTRGRCLPEFVMRIDPKELILCGEIFHEWRELCRGFAGDSAETLDIFLKTINLGLEVPSSMRDLLGGTNQRPDPRNSLSPAAEVFFPLLQRQMMQCRLFTIESIKDHSPSNVGAPLVCGIGPEELQEKDKICVLAGCKAPVALRPDGNRYRFVSPVFVDGLMDGQAIEGVDTGLYSWNWFEMH